ncbi:ATP-binding cassette domain-containing protein, partial [bacterium]
MSAGLATKALCKRFPARDGGEPVRALEGVEMTIGAGEFVSIVGPSGCGKSTLFNILAGLDRPSSGEILLGGRRADRLLGEIGYMPQHDLLMPWRTVLDNAALGLEMNGVAK